MQSIWKLTIFSEMWYANKRFRLYKLEKEIAKIGFYNLVTFKNAKAATPFFKIPLWSVTIKIT